MAEEVAPVLLVEREQRRGLGHETGHEAGPVTATEVAATQPGVRGDDVGRDEGVLQVEGDQLALWCQDLPTEPLGPALTAPGRGPHRDPTRLHDRWQVDVGYVATPVDHPRVEVEGGLVGVVQGVPQAQQVVEPVYGLALGVCAVQVHVALGSADQLALFLQADSDLGVASPHGQGLEDLLRTFERSGRSL